METGPGSFVVRAAKAVAAAGFAAFAVVQSQVLPVAPSNPTDGMGHDLWEMNMSRCHFQAVGSGLAAVLLLFGAAAGPREPRPLRYLLVPFAISEVAWGFGVTGSRLLVALLGVIGFLSGVAMSLLTVARLHKQHLPGDSAAALVAAYGLSLAVLGFCTSFFAVQLMYGMSG